MIALGHDYKIFVVNDGSTDNTSELCSKFENDFPLEEIGFDENMGVDAAFKKGFSEVFDIAKDGDIIVTKEADNTSDPDILKRMIQSIDAGSDVVLASCFAKEGGIENSTIDRHILSFGANTMLKICFPIKGVNTYSSFYRAYNAKSLKMAFEAYQGRLLEVKGFVCMVEMVVKLSRLPLKITEVPMVLRCDMREGASKMRRRKTIAGYLKFIGSQMVRSRMEDRIAIEKFRAMAGFNAG
jgi:dolichol-phosphate mannosyltransferase